MMTGDQPRGILRNKSVSEDNANISHDIDRQEVIRNTLLNAQLAAESSEGDRLRAELANHHSHDKQGEEGEHLNLKWDEINLYITEQEKAATMKIDEPKTPYEGGFNPSGEYYQDDGDDEDDDIPDFQLGEAEADADTNNHKIVESLNGGEIVRNEDEDDDDDDDDDDEPQERKLTAAERHALFEQKRKAHYHMKGDVLHHPQLDE